MDRKLETNVDVVRPLTFRFTLAQLVGFVLLVAGGTVATQQLKDGQSRTQETVREIRTEVAEMRSEVREMKRAYQELASTAEVLRSQQSGTQRQVDDLSAHVSELARRVDAQRVEFDRLSDLLARRAYQPSPGPPGVKRK